MPLYFRAGFGPIRYSHRLTKPRRRRQRQISPIDGTVADAWVWFVFSLLLLVLACVFGFKNGAEEGVVLIVLSLLFVLARLSKLLLRISP